MNTQTLKQFTLLQGFSDDELHAIEPSITEKILQAGEYLFHIHDKSTEIYLICRGRVEVYQADSEHLISVLTTGDEVGVLALLDGSPRFASARAIEETHCYVLTPAKLPATLVLLNRLLGNTTLVCSRRLRKQSNNAPQPTMATRDTPVHEELRRFSLFYGLSSVELEALAQLLETRSLAAGEYLFHEHERTPEVYFIRSGSLEICKPDSHGVQHVISVLESGREVGELTLIDGAPRSASVRAAEDSDLWVLNTNRLPENLLLINRFISNLTQAGAEKLRYRTEAHVQSLQRELAAVRLQNEFGQFFIYALSVLAIGTFVNYLLHTYLHFIDVRGELFKWTYLFVLLLPSLLLVRIMKIPWADIGVTLNNSAQSLREGLFASLGFIAVFFALLLTLRGMSILPDHGFHPDHWRSLNYTAHSVLQELLARGITQTAFERFFNDRRGVKAVLLSSAIFALFHIHFGLAAVLITFVSSLAFGAFYLRHHNLIGVSLLHATVGICAFGAKLI